jgi:hypothetical protein
MEWNTAMRSNGKGESMMGQLLHVNGMPVLILMP